MKPRFDPSLSLSLSLSLKSHSKVTIKLIATKTSIQIKNTQKTNISIAFLYFVLFLDKQRENGSKERIEGRKVSKFVCVLSVMANIMSDGVAAVNGYGGERRHFLWQSSSSAASSKC